MQNVLTPSVLAAQEHYYGRRASIGSAPERDPLTDEERTFIEARESFYMAIITESGWPYIQHRGGPRGFLRVVSPTQLAFADITPRYTAAEVEEAVAPLRQRIAELEAQLKVQN